MVSVGAAIEERQAKQFNPVVLAFVGDAVYSLYVREKLCLCHDLKTGELQKLTSECVSAHGQNALLEKIRPLFTPEEEGVFLRGRNAKKGTKSKAATVAEYNRSTGIEAVIGYLYLTGQSERLNFLLQTGSEES